MTDLQWEKSKRPGYASTVGSTPLSAGTNQYFLIADTMWRRVLFASWMVSSHLIVVQGLLPLTSNGHRRVPTPLHASVMKDLSSLPEPPFKRGFLQPLRDLVAYLKNPDAFIAQRSAELDSPIFGMYLFFKPTIVVGGQANVNEFTRERELPAQVVYSDMPATFLELHTQWGSLNLDANDVVFTQARGLFKDLLSSPAALSYHTQVLEPAIQSYVDQLVQRVEDGPAEQEFQLVPEVLELCLQLFSKTFTGKGLSSEQVQMLLDYNSALLSISKVTPGFKRGRAALEALKEEFLERFQQLSQASDVNDDNSPGMFYWRLLQNREGFEDPDRIASATVLFVWGAYVECASLMLDAMALVNRYGSSETGSNSIRDNIVAEFAQAQRIAGASQTDFTFWTKHMPYTRGVLRETLRLEPPGAGVPRKGIKDFQLGGYCIPAGMAVMMDPRIGNRDAYLYEEPQSFEPFRWTPTDAPLSAASTGGKQCPFTGTALKLGPGSWFPGGNGAHKCPGVPLAEIVSTMFLAKLSERLEWTSASKDEIDYVHIPIKILPNDFGFILAKPTSPEHSSL